MSNIELKDYLASRIISFNKIMPGIEYGKIYYQTNEDLLDAYLDIDFYNKDVLSVLASGDQVLTSRYLEARRVDAFDKNRLTYYYFYLRLWSIKYKNELYPKILGDNTNWLRSLLQIVKPNSIQEEKALLFWKKHVEEQTIFKNLFFDIDSQPIGKTLFTKASELEECLDSNLSFYDFDLFGENSIERKYDILLISNILEWARKNPSKIEKASQNILSLLNQGGVVIGTTLIGNGTYDKETIKEIFSPHFDIEEKENTLIYIRK